jgi:hypothetical protein
VFLLAGGAFGSRPLSAVEDDDRFVVIHAGRILTVSGEEIEDGTIVLRNGAIDAVGKKVEIPWGAEIIDARGEVVMPGLIDPRSRFSLPRYTRGGVHCDLSVVGELYPQDHDFRSVLEAGFTTLGLYPDGAGFPGQAVAVRPVNGGVEAMKPEEGRYVRVTLLNPSSDKKAFMDAFKRAKQEIDKVDKARKAWEEKKKKEAEEAQKKAEEEKKKQGEKPEDKPAPGPEPPPPPKPDPGPDPRRGGAPGNGTEPKPEEKKPEEKKGEAKKPDVFVPPPIDPAYQPLVDLIQKKEGVRLLVEIQNASGYLHYLDAIERIELDVATEFYVENRPVPANFGGGGIDLGEVVDKIGEKDPLVVLNAYVNNRFVTQTRFNLPAELVKAGCRIAFTPLFDGGETHADLRMQVATLVKSGLGRKEALEALTLRGAEALGLESTLGTIEKDRRADLLFLSHDPFDPRARVTRVMIAGETVSRPVGVQ